MSAISNTLFDFSNIISENSYSPTTNAATPTKPVTETTTSATTTSKKFLVKVTVSALNVRSGAGTNYNVRQVIRDRGTYTIVETKKVNGVEWGRLKSGAGWICLTYTKRV